MYHSIYSLKAILTYFKLKFITNGILYKHGALSTASLMSAGTITAISLEDSYFGLSLMLILIYCLFVFLDSITGILYSRSKGEAIESGKLVFTFYKLLFSFMFFWLLDSLNTILDFKLLLVQDSFMNYFYYGCKEGIAIVTYSVFTLLTLREWLSIGENIEKKFKKKLYLFSIVERIFDSIEKNLMKWLSKNEDNSSEA